ncbi:PIN domain-containing protein [Candidatus Uhrbacteria bacterium]|nr:PIN domain-containing protein [Candidatus Uhrbacteria bacterium]
MQLVIDSSVFVAAFREQEKDSAVCFRLLTQLEQGKLTAIIPVSVLLEVVAAIARRTSDVELARRVGARLVSFSSLSFIDLSIFRTLQYLDLTAELKLAGMDAIVVGTAKEFNLPLVTLDKEIQRRASGTVTCVSVQDLF